MTERVTSQAEPAPAARARWRRTRLAAVLAIFILAGLAVAWFSRERLVHDLVSDVLVENGISAAYEIKSIGPKTQILRNVVVGNPGSPDLTVDEVTIKVAYRLGLPRIGSVRLVRPRLYGTWRAERVSFGTLDQLLYGGDADKPVILPDLYLAIEDARGLVRSPYGDLGWKLDGAGRLDDGFAGIFGAVAPLAEVSGCRLRGFSAYGKITVRRGRPGFNGPVRLSDAACPKNAGRLENLAFSFDVRADSEFQSLGGSASVSVEKIGWADNVANSLSGTIDLAAGSGSFTSEIDITGKNVSVMGVRLNSLTIEGTGRSRDRGRLLRFDGSLAGDEAGPSAAMDAVLADAGATLDGTLLAPLVGKLMSSMKNAQRGSALSADLSFRKSGEGFAIVVPQAAWRSRSGDTLLGLSRAQWSYSDDDRTRLAGHFATGGAGLPKVTGSITQSGETALIRVKMNEYAAGDSRLSLPHLTIALAENGSASLSGLVMASGTVPGGFVTQLKLPVSGRVAGDDVYLWNRCVRPRFASLKLAGLALGRQELTVCPARSRSIVSFVKGALHVAAGVPGLDLRGTLGDTPVHIASGAVGVGYPGALVANDIDVTLGPEDAETRFQLSALKARLGPGIDGSFEEAQVSLAAVPLDLTNAGGRWTWQDEGLSITDLHLRVSDRQADQRFEPLIAQGARLRFADDRIVAEGVLREPVTKREVVAVTIEHRLADASGRADLAVAGLTFDNALQPDDLTPLTLGTVANVSGTIRGNGWIAWTDESVTSEGRFSSDSLDFAAAFGPVNGMAGTIVFTDLLEMVTAPHQRFTIKEVNPGIPVEDGIVDITLEPGMVLAFHSGVWPFLGGTLTMEPTRLALGVEEVRRYILTIEGLDTARFIERMELANISATGTLDGTVPLVFDKDGGRIENGVLIARRPGGNISYVGALTYEDMSAMANFAFDALRSLDYTGMRINMDGSLEGEIVTRVKIDGVSQGEGAKSNFLTRRIAALPIRFDINVRAPFYQLITSMKSLYDPTAVRDPRELGLVSDEIGKFVPRRDATQTPGIQPPESESLP